MLILVDLKKTRFIQFYLLIENLVFHSQYTHPLLYLDHRVQLICVVIVDTEKAFLQTGEQ